MFSKSFSLFFVSISLKIISICSLSVQSTPDTDKFLSALNLSCDTKFDQAERLFAFLPQESPHYSASLHSLGNIAALKGNLLLSGMYHKLAKLRDPNEQPPLAIMYQEKHPCNNIGDIFWTSSFTKKRMYETFFEKRSSHRKDIMSVKDYESLKAILKKEELSILFDAHIGLATQLEDSGLTEYSMKHFQYAAVLKPYNLDLKIRNALMVPVLYDSVAHVEKTRESLETNVCALIRMATEENTTLPSLNHLSMPGTFYIVYQGFNDAKLIAAIRKMYSLFYSRLERVYLSQEEGYSLAYDPAVNSPGKIRVGFASHYFRKHSVCKLLCGLINNLNPDLFHVTIFSSAPIEKEDEWTTMIKERSDKFIHLKQGMLLRDRNMPFDESLDILIYPDIGMESGSSMWAASRLAKYQICFWGHPTTTGLSNMDYFVTSEKFETRDSQERFTEQLIQMDSLSFYFKKPFDISKSIIKNKYSKFDFSSFGVPLNGILILCPQTLPKFHPMFDEVIHRILDHGKNIYIVGVYNEDKVFWKNKLLSRFNSTSQHYERFILIPTQSENHFYNMIHQSTLLLDPFPFGGGVTSLEAFAACKSIVTLPSSQSVPQLTSGMLKAMNLTKNLLVNNVDEYVDSVIRLISNKTLRLELEKKICERSHVLYNQKNVVDEWEFLFQRLMMN